MNPFSRLFFVPGIFMSTTICSGQQPLCKKSMLRFAAEITRVDSILSSSSFYKQRTQESYLQDAGSDKDSLRFEFILDRIKQKRVTICPATAEADRPKKI
jgi:hypothetical protein